MANEAETIVGVGILATIAVSIYALLKKEPEKDIMNMATAYDSALERIKTLHETSEDVKTTLKAVADDIASKVDTSLPLKGVVIVVKEVRDIVTEQLSKLGGGGGDTERLFT